MRRQEPDGGSFLPEQLRLLSFEEAEEDIKILRKASKDSDVPDYINDSWFPFAEDGGGGYCVVHTKTGAVLYFPNDGGKAHHLADSVNDWLEDWLQSLRAGKVVVEDGVLEIKRTKKWWQIWT